MGADRPPEDDPLSVGALLRAQEVAWARSAEPRVVSYDFLRPLQATRTLLGPIEPAIAPESMGCEHHVDRAVWFSVGISIHALQIFEEILTEFVKKCMRNHAWPDTGGISIDDVNFTNTVITPGSVTNQNKKKKKNKKRKKKEGRRERKDCIIENCLF